MVLSLSQFLMKIQLEIKLHQCLSCQFSNRCWHGNNLRHFIPKRIIVVHTYSLYAINVFDNIWTSHLEFFYFFSIYLIRFIFKLLRYSKIFNKHWKNWKYGICLWQNNTCHKVWKYVYIYIYIWKLGLLVEFLGECFCGEWYWYTSIEYKTIWKFKTFGWKFMQ
jgi:hypothetical protein